MSSRLSNLALGAVYYWAASVLLGVCVSSCNKKRDDQADITIKQQGFFDADHPPRPVVDKEGRMQSIVDSLNGVLSEDLRLLEDVGLRSDIKEVTPDLMRLISMLAAVNPECAIELIKIPTNPQVRAELFDAVFGQPISLSIAEKFRVVGEHFDASDQVAAISSVIENAPEDGREIGSHLMGLSPGGYRTALVSRLISTWSAHDLESALEWIDELELKEELRGARLGLARGLENSSDLLKLQSVIADIEDPSIREVLGHSIGSQRALAGDPTDPSGFDAILDEFGSDPAMNAVMDSYIATRLRVAGPAEIQSLLEKDEIPAASRRRALDAVMTTMVATDPGASFEWLIGLDLDEGEIVFEANYDDWISSQSTSATEWAINLPEGKYKDIVARTTSDYLIRLEDYEAASAWVEIIQNEEIRAGQAEKLASRIPNQ